LNPLQNKKVLVTRAEHQCKSVEKLLSYKGAETTRLSLIAIRAIADQTAIKSAVAQLESINWVVFTSVNAVNYFFEALEKYEVKVHFLTDLRIATVGEKTKAAVEKIGYRSNFVPIEFTAKMLAKQLPLFGHERILIPQSSKANNEYVELLKEQCDEVIPLPMYENYDPAYSKEELEAILNQDLDWITFFSGSAVTNFAKQIERNHLSIPIAKIAVVGPSTQKVAEEKGFNVTVVANPYTEEGMVEAIVNYEQHV
tara:strand:+ start:3659 stop:4423 length:765 start_codon:yes stop_codon:yes gene_type:complete